MIYYGSKLSPHMTATPEGYLVAHDVRINRVGLYKYMGHEIGLDGEDAEKQFNVMRRPEEVFSPATLASFEGKPITDEHPPENVGPDNIHVFGKGHAQNIRKGTGKNEGYTIADLWITDPQLIDDIKDAKNGKREISCGYNFDLFENPNGTYEQRGLLGNHIAIVPDGRAGRNVAIEDSEPQIERRSENMSKGSIFGRALKALARDESTTPDDLEEAAKELGGKKGEDEDLVEPNPLPKKEDPEKAPAKDAEPSSTDALLERLLGMLEPICAKLTEQPAMTEDKDELENIIDPEKKDDEEEEEVEDFDPVKNEESVTIDPEEIKKEAKDAARIVRDALRKSIKDPVAFKAAAKDAAANIRKAYGIIDAPKNEGYGKFTQATKQAARAVQDSITTSEQAQKEAQAAYDARNPHMKKKEAK